MHVKGNPEATTDSEFRQFIRLINPKKEDVFYDLGCGYRNPCKSISKYVKLAVGIEDDKLRYRKAVRNTISKKYPNVKIIFGDFTRIPLYDATIIYSTSLDLVDFIRINDKMKQGTRIVSVGLPPPYPMKSKGKYPFYICKKPYQKVRNPDEYAQIYFNDKDVLISDMLDDITPQDRKDLKGQISKVKSNWNKLKS